MSEEKKPWRAEMPSEYYGFELKTAFKTTCRDLVTRANAELDAAAARERSKDARIAELEAELKATRKAKQEHDDRFMRERDEALARAEGLEFRVNGLNKLNADYERQSKWQSAKIAELESRICELTEWRPMETAPKDGTEILVLSGDGLGWSLPMIFDRNRWHDCDAPHDPEDGVSLAPKRIRLVATQLVHAQSMREKAERERDEALARSEKAEARVKELEYWSEFACETPAAGCDCPGCSLARSENDKLNVEGGENIAAPYWKGGHTFRD